VNRKSVLPIVLTIIAVALGLCGAAATPTFAGQKINVLLSNGSVQDNWKRQVPNFEAKTGIQVTVDQLPEDQEMPKVRTVLAAKSDEYDVIFYRGNLMPELTSAGGVEALDPYIAKSKVQDKEFDYEGFVPAILSAFNLDGKQWGLPLMGAGTILYHNKDAFKAAGLDRPPRNLDELEQYAAKLKTPTQAAICLRAKREMGINVFAWIFIWKIQGAKWFDNVRGNWFDEKWEPQLTTKEAIAATERYVKMLRNFGPMGIASYGWQECLLDFQQGAVAMWLDSIVWLAAMEDPKQSKIVGKVGYSVVEGPGNRYGAADPWGFIMNAYSKNKDAAWELIRWATSNETTLAMAKNKFGSPCRTKVIESDAMRANAPAEFVSAMGKAMSVADPAYKPLTKNLSEINDLTSIAISKVLTGQATAADAMKEANDAIRAIMKRDGYIK